MPNIVKLNKDLLSGAAEVGIEIIPPATEPDISPGLSVNATAMLELIVLKKEAAFQMPNFLKGDVPEKSDILLQERVLNIT